MNITLKENLILNNIIGNYIISNSLYYDECKSLYDVVNRLKKERFILINSRSQYEYCKKEAKKELRQYDIKRICNKKILELDKLEKKNNTRCNGYIENRLSYEEWLKVAKTNKRSK